MDIPEFKKGVRPPAKSINAMATAIRKFANITGDGIDVDVSVAGVSIRGVTREKIFAKLTGGTNPYAWTEQVMFSGTWVTPTNARTGTTTVNPAYEVNGVTGLVSSTKVVELEHGFGQEWIFSFIQHGTSPPPPPPPACSLIIHVGGCVATISGGVWTSVGINISGATVVVTLGGTSVGSGTTDAFGNVTIPVAITAGSPVTYTIVVSASGYQTQTFSETTTCTGGISIPINITLLSDDIVVQASVGRCDADGTGTTVSLGGGSGNTDPTGVAIFTITRPSSPTTLTGVASGPSPYYDNTAISILSTDSQYPSCVWNLSVNMILDSSYTCCQWNTSGSSGGTLIARPTPNVMHVTVGGVAFTLNIGSGTPCSWVGCQTIDGLVCQVILNSYDPSFGAPDPDAHMTVKFFCRDPGQTFGTTFFWDQGLCTNGTSTSNPVCNGAGNNVTCSTGFSFFPPPEGFQTCETYFTMATTGTTPFLASGSFDTFGNGPGGSHVSGCPFAGAVTCSE